jgi:hypothetical protein
MRRATLFLLGLVCVAASADQPGGRDFGVELFPGSRPAPELARRLDTLRNVRWIASGAFHADASLSEVLSHFQKEQTRHEGPDSLSREPSDRLKEWLRRNPEELARYRQFQRDQAGQAPPNWQTLVQQASEIPASLGGGQDLRGLAGRQVEMGFGRIVLPDSVSRTAPPRGSTP